MTASPLKTTYAGDKTGIGQRARETLSEPFEVFKDAVQSADPDQLTEARLFELFEPSLEAIFQCDRTVDTKRREKADQVRSSCATQSSG